MKKLFANRNVVPRNRTEESSSVPYSSSPCSSKSRTDDDSMTKTVPITRDDYRPTLIMTLQDSRFRMVHEPLALQDVLNGRGDKERISNTITITSQAHGKSIYPPSPNDDAEDPPVKRRSWTLLALVILVVAFLVCVGISLVALCKPSSDVESSSSSSSDSKHDDPTSYFVDKKEPENSTNVGTEAAPTKVPTGQPSASPSQRPTGEPTAKPTADPTVDPSSGPSLDPTSDPTVSPTEISSNSLTAPNATYIPGNLTRFQEGILLSEGLLVRKIATSDQPVELFNSDGNYIYRSSELFHIRPDGAATFPDTREWNLGGWIYVSNSESLEMNEGGVGTITFDKDGRVIDYQKVLDNTTMNCSGGRTPWNTWVSCEEVEFDGLIYQVDPFGEREPQVMTLGSDGGRWEAFAYDIRNLDVPHFFATEDHNKGTVRRFTPETTLWGTGNEWEMLHGKGLIDYLVVSPNENRTGGTFEWVQDLEAARNNARSYYPQSEGISVQDGIMYVTLKRLAQLFIFDLDQLTYKNMSTVSGLFDGNPDQLQRILGDDGGLLYFTEEGGDSTGVHARDEDGRFFTILESPVHTDETTGLAFSPDGKHMYVCFQKDGLVFDVWREDMLPFHAKAFDVRYHHRLERQRRQLSSQWVGL